MIKFLIFICFLVEGYSWTHLEIGAGNYGADGHTQASQKKTVLRFLAASGRSYIDDLPEKGTGNYVASQQYGILFWTLDELVKRYGEEGIFYINDLYEEYANFAKKSIKSYAIEKGYHKIEVKTIVCDYDNLNGRYSSVHLKNPELHFYNDKMIDGDCFASEESIQKARRRLQKFAKLSETGLYFFILTDDDFIPISEKIEMEKDSFYQVTTDWPIFPYIFPEGQILKSSSDVFLIKSP